MTGAEFIPAEAVQAAMAATSPMRSVEMETRAKLAAALPYILAAYDAQLPAEHECPACGAVTRERMAY